MSPVFSEIFMQTFPQTFAVMHPEKTDTQRKKFKKFTIFLNFALTHNCIKSKF